MSGRDSYPRHGATVNAMHNITPPADLLTVGAVPRDYPISSRTVFRRLQAGMLTRYRIDGNPATFVSRAELDALLAPRAA